MKYIKFFLLLATTLIFVSSFITVAHATSCPNEQTLTKGFHVIAYVSLEHSQPKRKQFNIHDPTLTTPPENNYLTLKNVSVDGGRDLVIELWENDAKQRFLLSAPLNRYSKKYGGISTLDNIYIEWPKSTLNNWPVISITQTSIPGKNERYFSPGPPENFIFKYQADSQCYQYTREGE